MAFKGSMPADQLRTQAGQEREISKRSNKPTTTNGRNVAAKETAFNWAKGGIFTPDEAQPAWFRPGSRAFTETRYAAKESFDSWDKAFQATDAGFAFRPPPPEPEKPMAGGGGKETA